MDLLFRILETKFGLFVFGGAVSSLRDLIIMQGDQSFF